MVRRKRKGLVKESLAGGDATGAPRAADVRSVVRDVPLNARVPFVVETDTKKSSNAEPTEPLDLAAWFASLCDATTRFEQLRALQAFRAGVKRLTGTETDFVAFAEATWRLFARLHGDASLQPLQKNFALVLSDLVAVHALEGAAAWPLESIAREELRVVLSALFASTESGDADAVARRISHLQSLLELPFLLKVLVHDSDNGLATSTLRRAVHFLADQLAVLVAPIAEYQAAHGEDRIVEEDDDEKEGSSSATNAVLMASERASVALKCIIVLAGWKDTLCAQLVGAGASFVDAAVDVARLLGFCTLILKTRVVHKDLLTQTGLAYCLVLRVLLHGALQNTLDKNVSNESICFLLDTVYQKPVTSSVLTDEIRGHLNQDMRSFGEFARLAVLRGFVNSLSDDELTFPASELLADKVIASDTSQRSILDVVFETVHGYCSDESLNTRLYAFQVLEAFLRRAVAVLGKMQASTPNQTQTQRQQSQPITTATVASLTSAVLLNWENPSKRVNQFMHLMFTHIVHFQVLSRAFDDWKQLAVAKLIQLPPHSRARYGGLSILVTQYGAATLLKENPALLQSILYAVGIKDVSAAAAALFTQLLDELKKAEDLATWRKYWMGDVVGVLLSDDAKLRASVAMYALPLLLKQDPTCVALLIDTLRSQGSNAAMKKDVSLWAIIEVLKFARRKIAPENLLGLSVVEIQQGLENARGEARGAAFEALCASLKSTQLPTADEVHLLKKFLVVSAKEITAATRVNALNGLKTVFFRVKEFLRIHDKPSSNPRETPEEKAFLAQEIARAKDFQSWVELFIVTSVYPGSLVQRSIVGLEVLLLHLQVFGVPAVGGDSLLMTPHMVTCLLNMLIGSWDVIRALANAILDLYPAELPGFTTSQALETLWQWALTLCISPRQRESDAGAHFMLLLYTRSDSLVAHGVAGLPETLPATGATLQDARVRLVLKLTDTITQRLASADLSRGESPLVHGLLLALRSMIDHTSFGASVPHPDEWQHALAQVFTCVHATMQLSLAVVGDATSGVGDESLSDTFEGGVVGEVSAAGGKTAAIPLRVDCRGHLILEDTDKDNETAKDDDADTEQRAVVGSWLAARECGAIVDTILRRVPLPTENGRPAFFEAELARQGGEMLLNSLFELKHKGAVATAYESFEGVCKSLLAHGEKHAMLGSLPSQWADKLLTRLEKSEQQFILRRSSGFAYSFVAILRAEPRHTAASILPRVMSNLLRLASQDTDAMAAATQEGGPSTHLVWRSRVHALNILKLISQDAVLADDVAVYVSQMLELAIFGFECRSWVVRNSSMMLFAAATQRALGDKRIADGASQNKIPSAEVFSRFPQLAGFLYHALDRFTHAATTQGVVPPGLFPVLMFLSRLRPTEELEDAELRARGSQPLADFVPLVLTCASQSVLPIRQMAANVLGAIVRVDMALPVLKQLSEALPQGVRASPAVGLTDGEVSRPKPKSNNYVHGVLLQVQRLVTKCLAERTAHETTTTEVIDHVLRYVTTDFLPKHLWLSSDRVQCASIRSVVWEMVDVLFQYEAQWPGRLALGDLVGAVTTATLQKIDALVAGSSAATTTRSPGDYNCHRAIVGTFFSLLRLAWPSTASDSATDKTWIPRIESLLQSSVLEARKRAFKKLADFLDASAFLFKSHVAMIVRLQAVLVQQLVVESHPTVKTRLLKLLITIQDSSVASHAPLASNALAIHTLLDLLATSANVNVVGPSLQLLATAVRDASAPKDDTTVSVLRALQHQVLERSSDAQPLGLRYAAAVAIERSDLLLTHVVHRNGTLEIALDTWRAAITLLQDDDSNVRGVIRVAVHRALRATAPDAFLLDASVSETALLPVAIQYVVQTFSSFPTGVDVISKLLLATIDAPSVLVEYSTGAKAQDWGDLSTRIFEAEGNNFYAENDLVAQLLATCVFQQDAMAALKKTVLDRVVESLALLNASRSRAQWLGGMAYYASVFPTLCSLLCVGVAAVASLTETERKTYSELLAKVREQAATARPFLEQTHPLLAQAVAALSEGEGDRSVVRDLVFLSPEWTAIQ